MKQRTYRDLILSSSVDGWGNGGSSDDPTNPSYGTHDWIAEHALDYLPEAEIEYILNNKAEYLYGTKLPDKQDGEDAIGDWWNMHVYFNSDGSLEDDAAAERAQEEYENTVTALKRGEHAKAARHAGIMTHYFEVAVFGHVMGRYTDWGHEYHHSDYETYVGRFTTHYNSTEFDIYLVFDGTLETISAYKAVIDLALNTTFNPGGYRTCTWMDANYNWSNPRFKARCGESLNLAVNYIADVLHTIAAKVEMHSTPGAQAEAAREQSFIDFEWIGIIIITAVLIAVYVVVTRKYF